MLGLIVGHTPSYEFLLVSKDNSFMLVFIHGNYENILRCYS
jgi:hypothetical protein